MSAEEPTPDALIIACRVAADEVVSLLGRCSILVRPWDAAPSSYSKLDAISYVCHQLTEIALYLEVNQP